MRIKTLDIHPVFGYETGERWVVAVHQRKAYDQLWDQQREILNNFSKVASYIPGVNVIVGLARIIYCSRDLYKTKDLEKKIINAWHIGRGVAEIFLGPLLIIADVIQTIRDRSLVNAYMKALAALPLFNAVEKGDLAHLKQVLLTKKLSVNSFNCKGMPLLVYAVQHQKHEIIKYLLDQPDLNSDISLFNHGVDTRCTALHEACNQNDANTIQLLLQKKESAPNPIV